MIEYKGYIGAIDFDPEIDLFHGTVINTNDVISFYGASVNELREEMQKSIEGYLEFCGEQGKVPEKPFAHEFTIQMNPEIPDLRSTIAHILAHKRCLAGANEATTQEYIILPILRALGWDDTNLASMEVLPEYRVGNGNVDYALKIGQRPVLFIECKKWNEPLERHEDQIVNYASNSNVPIAALTNGKIWRFYLSGKKGVPVRSRIFCDIDNENLDAAVFNLKKYLLKCNVSSGLATKEAEEAWQGKEVIEKSVPQNVRNYYHENYPPEKVREFYRYVSSAQVLARKSDWGLEEKFTQRYCGFWLRGKARRREMLIHGIHFDYTPFRLFVKVSKEDVEKLRHQHGCEIVYYHTHARQAHYVVPGDISELLPVLEFAYNKHRGN
ncbi:MAG: type I restriction enzyme HsdR N-terminal domain-containing protein [Candidatus Poribacteria bacterium]|nr:type I restriction enzyme HsdR N-terminal domain-containing protein [Candidatus Poribacteria bacterium]